jgi:thioredoxin reductase
VKLYNTLTFFDGLAANGAKTKNGFVIHTSSDEKFESKKLIFSTGIIDVIPNIDGYTECWGVSVLHCPYCHGYEVRNEKTGILGNGEYVFEFSKLISNWTKDLTLFTNGPLTLTAEQITKIEKHKIKIVEKEIEKLEHTNGYIRNIIFNDGTRSSMKALYARTPFTQHCNIPETLGCEMTNEGYIITDIFQRTSVHGIYASGDNATRMRTVANAVATGTAAGMTANKDIIEEAF